MASPVCSACTSCKPDWLKGIGVPSLGNFLPCVWMRITTLEYFSAKQTPANAYEQADGFVNRIHALLTDTIAPERLRR